MAKPKLDFKKLLLERGERIGLSVAGIITLLLLLVSLLWPGKGLFSGSPDEKAKGLNEPAAFITQRLSDPNNQPGDGDKPDKNSNEKLIAYNMETVDPEKYRMKSLGGSIDAGSAGRRVPRTLGIDEAVVKLARMQIQTYMMDNNGKIYVLQGKENSVKAGQGKGMMGMTGPKGKTGGSMGGGPKGPGGPRGGAGLPPSMSGGGSGEEKRSKSVRAISLTDLATSTNSTPAERIHPMRMAIVAASFPYKAQIEEFRSKLALRSANEVLTENSVEKIKGHILPSFHFTGVEVERRELDGDGNPIGKNGGWTTLDLQGDYQQWVILSGARFEEEDPELKAISFPGLVMPRLQGFRPDSASKGDGMAGPGGLGTPPGAARGPGAPMGPGGRPPMGKGPGDGNVKEEGEKHKDLYPAVERDLANIRRTLESLKGKSGAEVLAPPSRFQGVADIFNPTAPTEPKAKDGDEKPTTPDEGKTDPEAREVPEHCLVRVVDTTILPGKTYEYRLRVKMLNPNYKRLDVASTAYAKEETLPSEWSKPTPPVHVDPELRYYAIDQKALDAAEKIKYNGPNWDKGINSERQVWLQADRWVERVKIRPTDRDEIEIGEWTVAERFSAYRGEYVGRSLRIQLPLWRYDREEFVIANDFKTKTKPNSPARPEIEVNFGYGSTGTTTQPEAIAVDFQSGRQTIEKVKTRNEEGAVATVEKVTDDAASEVLLLDPNGRLRLLEGGLDAIDATREARRLQARERVREISQGGKKVDGGKGDTPFGNN